MTDIATIARVAICAMLDGSPPNGVLPSELGQYGDLYAEMKRAHAKGGIDAARKVYASYAESDAAIAQLIAGDPAPRKVIWTVADLMTTEFPPVKWLIESLLTVGLVVLAGRPKLGKSWFALQLAIAVALGGMVLGRRVNPGKVLYLALEDNPRRLQDRLRKQRATVNAAIDFRFEWQPLTKGGTADLMTAINEQGYSLIIIDTISRALGHADQLDQADMNVTFGSLQRLAMEKDVCVLLIDHHRKSAGGAGDVIDDVMGATSKVGVADAAIGIYRERGQSGATLKISGRDVDDQELAIQFDSELFTWQLMGTAAGVKSESVQGQILDALEELGGSATAAKIAQWLGRDRSNVRSELLELAAKGIVRRGAKDGREIPYELVDSGSDD